MVWPGRSKARAAVEFRKVEVLNLAGGRDEKAKSYKSYFEKDDPASCRYD